MRYAAAAAAMLAVLAGLLAWWLGAGGEFRLPARMRVEEIAADLAASLDGATVLEQPAGSPVRVGGLTPSPEYEATGGYRRAIVAPPPSAIRWRTRVPAAARLRLRFGATRPDAARSEAAALRFTLALDGRPIFTRDVDPARRRRDRGWLEHEADLGAFAGREVELTLSTRAVGTGPLGTPGWSQLRILREQRVERQPARVDAPSVLVLLVDTLRADALGCYGARPSPSPTLDRLAERALVFEQAVAQSSWTVPSVASLFTGLYPRSHGVWGAPHDAPDTATDTAFLPDALPTLADAAQRAGITTFGVSANPLISRGTNFAQGFETFVEFGMERRFAPGGRGKRWASAADVDERFVAWLRRNRGYRFLAYLHYMEPHDPYTPPDGLRPPPPAGMRPMIARGEVFEAAQKINWHGGTLLPEAEVAYLRRLYEGEIAAWDAELARLLAALDRLGVRDSTVIVVTADHGEEFQEHGALRHGVNLYDATIRVPLAIAGPGITPGRVAVQAQGVDLFPTVAALLGFPPPSGAPGRNVLAVREPRPAFSELGGGLASVRADGWKLISAPGRYELYDLATDPNERENRFGVAGDGPALVALLAGWRDTAPPPPPVAGRDPRLLEKLRALGYVE